eukprot:GHVL01043368.1.p1 GENE.GHVL01043368.1~~GHVL01043368.1.p1  ORF type:complete len:1574 (-),score=301.54 GHVL01043368.1:4964-9685(-)
MQQNHATIMRVSSITNTPPRNVNGKSSRKATLCVEKINERESNNGPPRNGTLAPINYPTPMPSSIPRKCTRGHSNEEVSRVLDKHAGKKINDHVTNPLQRRRSRRLSSTGFGSSNSPTQSTNNPYECQIEPPSTLPPSEDQSIDEDELDYTMSQEVCKAHYAQNTDSCNVALKKRSYNEMAKDFKDPVTSVDVVSALQREKKIDPKEKKLRRRTAPPSGAQTGITASKKPPSGQRSKKTGATDNPSCFQSDKDQPATGCLIKRPQMATDPISEPPSQERPRAESSKHVSNSDRESTSLRTNNVQNFFSRHLKVGMSQKSDQFCPTSACNEHLKDEYDDGYVDPITPRLLPGGTPRKPNEFATKHSITKCNRSNNECLNNRLPSNDNSNIVFNQPSRSYSLWGQPPAPVIIPQRQVLPPRPISSRGSKYGPDGTPIPDDLPYIMEGSDTIITGHHQNAITPPVQHSNTPEPRLVPLCSGSGYVTNVPVVVVSTVPPSSLNHIVKAKATAPAASLLPAVLDQTYVHPQPTKVVAQASALRDQPTAQSIALITQPASGHIEPTALPTQGAFVSVQPTEMFFQPEAVLTQPTPLPTEPKFVPAEPTPIVHKMAESVQTMASIATTTAQAQPMVVTVATTTTAPATVVDKSVTNDQSTCCTQTKKAVHEHINVASNTSFCYEESARSMDSNSGKSSELSVNQAITIDEGVGTSDAEYSILKETLRLAHTKTDSSTSPFLQKTPADQTSTSFIIEQFAAACGSEEKKKDDLQPKFLKHTASSPWTFASAKTDMTIKKHPENTRLNDGSNIAARKEKNSSSESHDRDISLQHGTSAGGFNFSFDCGNGSFNAEKDGMMTADYPPPGSERKRHSKRNSMLADKIVEASEELNQTNWRQTAFRATYNEQQSERSQDINATRDPRVQLTENSNKLSDTKNDAKLRRIDGKTATSSEEDNLETLNTKHYNNLSQKAENPVQNECPKVGKRLFIQTITETGTARRYVAMQGSDGGVVGPLILDEGPHENSSKNILSHSDSTKGKSRYELLEKTLPTNAFPSVTVRYREGHRKSVRIADPPSCTASVDVQSHDFKKENLPHFGEKMIIRHKDMDNDQQDETCAWEVAKKALEKSRAKKHKSRSMPAGAPHENVQHNADDNAFLCDLSQIQNADDEQLLTTKLADDISRGLHSPDYRTNSNRATDPDCTIGKSSKEKRMSNFSDISKIIEDSDTSQYVQDSCINKIIADAEISKIIADAQMCTIMDTTEKQKLIHDERLLSAKREKRKSARRSMFAVPDEDERGQICEHTLSGSEQLAADLLSFNQEIKKQDLQKQCNFAQKAVKTHINRIAAANRSISKLQKQKEIFVEKANAESELLMTIVANSEGSNNKVWDAVTKLVKTIMGEMDNSVKICEDNLRDAQNGLEKALEEQRNVKTELEQMFPDNDVKEEEINEQTNNYVETEITVDTKWAAEIEERFSLLRVMIFIEDNVRLAKIEDKRQKDALQRCFEEKMQVRSNEQFDRIAIRTMSLSSSEISSYMDEEPTQTPRRLLRDLQDACRQVQIFTPTPRAPPPTSAISPLQAHS